MHDRYPLKFYGRWAFISLPFPCGRQMTDRQSDRSLGIPQTPLYKNLRLLRDETSR